MASNAITEYRQALARICANAPIRIPKGSKPTNDNVALEAGRTKGAVRASLSDEMANLCKDIKNAQASVKTRRDRSKPTITKSAVEARDAKIATLTQENEMLKARYMSLLYMNYELTRKLQEMEAPVPTSAEVVPFKIREELPTPNAGTDNPVEDEHPF